MKTKSYHWPIIVIANLVFSYVIAYPLAPLLSFFIDKEGYFPKWLWWFQTPDSNMDGCDGDAVFCQTHKTTNVWWRRTLWQWRNTAQGFSDYLGTSFNNPKLSIYGNINIGRLPTYRTGWYAILVRDDDGRTAFEFSCTYSSLPNRCWGVRLGWKLGNLQGNPKGLIPTVCRVNPLYPRGPL